MAKYVKFKKFIKVLSLSLLFIFLAGAGVCVGGYFIVTADTSLSPEKLKYSSSGVIITDINDQPLNTSSLALMPSEIPTHTTNAFIAKEDKRFYSHHGVDYIRILGAMKNNLKAHDSVEGGSTITQQLIKNTHLTQEKTLDRKLKEIKLSKELEKIYSKEEILDAYLNTIYFGNNLFGIKNASSFYFNKQVSDLSLAESAILSGLISAPSLFNPVTNLSLSKQKAETVLNLMEEQGYISENEHLNASAELATIKVEPTSSMGAVYLSFATAEALKILNLDTLPQNANIVIKTYLNPSLQSAMEERLESEEYKAQDLGGTMCGIVGIVMDNLTGGIIAFSGDSEYNLMDLKRQPASAIKPILVYGPALEQGLISPASFVLDEPININGYTPQNATKLNYGWTTVRDNLVRSTNIPAVKIMAEIGIENCKNFASKLGISFDPEDNNLAIALGGFNSGITPKDLATAYMAIARGGNFVDSTFIKEISINGLVCYTHNPVGHQVMKTSTAYLLTDMLKSVAQYGTGRNIQGLNLPIASKTGTNAINGINHDGWNVSYTSEHTALCWTGNLGGVAEISSSQYNGSLYATYFVKNLFENLYTNHTPNDFIKPENVVYVNLDKTAYDKHTLYQANEFSSGYVTEVFATDNLPPLLDPIVAQINLVEELSLPQGDVILPYIDLIKKYGVW